MAHSHKQIRGIGGNSANLTDINKIISSLGLKPGSTFLDVGCGRGYYILAAAPIIGAEGKLYGIDIWEEGINELNSKVQELGYENIITFVGDASEQIPVPKGEVDVVFLGVVLHDMVEAGIDAAVLAEITRVLKIDGILALLEWKKDAPLEPGPPREIRLEPKQLKAILLPYGFKLQKLKDWNDYHYLITFIYEGKSKIE